LSHKRRILMHIWASPLCAKNNYVIQGSKRQRNSNELPCADARTEAIALQIWHAYAAASGPKKGGYDTVVTTYAGLDEFGAEDGHMGKGGPVGRREQRVEGRRRPDQWRIGSSIRSTYAHGEFLFEILVTDTARGA
jgi:hypothetical protein